MNKKINGWIKYVVNNTKGSCSREDAGKETLKVRLQESWDSQQIPHCHQHRHALDQRRTLPSLFAPETYEKSTSCSAQNTEKSRHFISLWKKHNWIKFLSYKLESLHWPKCCFVCIDFGPWTLSKAIFSHKKYFSCLLFEYFEPINSTVLPWWLLSKPGPGLNLHYNADKAMFSFGATFPEFSAR